MGGTWSSVARCKNKKEQKKTYPPDNGHTCRRPAGRMRPIGCPNCRWSSRRRPHHHFQIPDRRQSRPWWNPRRLFLYPLACSRPFCVFSIDLLISGARQHDIRFLRRAGDFYKHSPKSRAYEWNDDRKMTNANESVCIWVRRCHLDVFPVKSIWYYFDKYLYCICLLYLEIVSYTFAKD